MFTADEFMDATEHANVSEIAKMQADMRHLRHAIPKHGGLGNHIGQSVAAAPNFGIGNPGSQPQPSSLGQASQMIGESSPAQTAGLNIGTAPSIGETISAAPQLPFQSLAATAVPQMSTSQRELVMPGECPSHEKTVLICCYFILPTWHAALCCQCSM